MSRWRWMALAALCATSAILAHQGTVLWLNEMHESSVHAKLDELTDVLVEAGGETIGEGEERIELLMRQLREQHELESEMFELEEIVADETVDVWRDVDPFYLVAAFPESRLALRLGPFDELVASPIAFGLIGVLPALLIAGLIALGMSASPRRQLLALRRAAGRLEAGDWTARVGDEYLSADQLGRLAVAINASGAQLQRLSESQKELLQAVSHELRTPPARIRFRLELLADATTSEERERHINGIDHDVTSLDALVDELLMYVRFDQDIPAQAREPVALKQLVEGVAREAMTGPDNVSISTDIKGIPAVLGDARQINRALENLVLNARRHASSKVRVSAAPSGPHVEVLVEDDGPGIVPEQRARIFEPFARVDAHRNKSSGGVGLGLAIVRRIIDAHGGEIAVGTSELGGARFRTLWPVADTNGNTTSTE